MEIECGLFFKRGDHLSQQLVIVAYQVAELTKIGRCLQQKTSFFATRVYVHTALREQPAKHFVLVCDRQTNCKCAPWRNWEKYENRESPWCRQATMDLCKRLGIESTAFIREFVFLASCISFWKAQSLTVRFIGPQQTLNRGTYCPSLRNSFNLNQNSLKTCPRVSYPTLLAIRPVHLDCSVCSGNCSAGIRFGKYFFAI